ncbi:LysM peptidoglycan-binding domain-containing protein [Candidatus Obscuribacterales bacterium]|nr:LysM peptidoglycan-binding domain-containing protein [Candidatus Obscuribacterales bacterium]
MTEKLDAQRVADDAAAALQTTDDATSKTMLQHVNEDLRALSEPERNYVANDLALKGLLPDLAIETGLVSEDKYATKEELAKVAADEGNSTVNGMAAKFLTDNFSALGGGPRTDTNADYVKGFDMRYDLALETANVKREFGGLLDLYKQQNPNDADIQARDGLQANDIDALLSKPEALSPAQSDALKTMKNNFDYMKTPRGVWTLTDWTTPRVNEESIGDFVNTAVPLGMAEQLKIAEAEKSKQAGLEEGARQAQQERQTPPESKPAEETPATPDTPPVSPDAPPVSPDAPPVSPDAPPVSPDAPPATPDTPPATPDTPPASSDTPPATPDTPPVSPDAPPVSPDAPPASPDAPPASPDAPPVSPDAPPVSPDAPPVSPDAPPVSPDAPPVSPDAPPASPDAPPATPDQPAPPATPDAPPALPEAPTPDAPPASPETPGDKPTPPESMERDTATDKEYTVVAGDNLWKIARAHLTELEGKRPNNADVLKLVNGIVARNNIKNPNLIYPDQKFIIPGPATKPGAAPAPVPAPAAPPES